MKKRNFIAAFLALVICIPFLVFNASAKKNDEKKTEENIGQFEVVCPEFAYRSDEIKVIVRVKENPGFLSMRLKVNYDKKMLTLMSARDLALVSGAIFTNDLSADDYYLTWNNSGIKENFTKTGNLAELVFKVNNDAAIASTEIEFSFDEEKFDIINTMLFAVPFSEAKTTLSVYCKHERTSETVLWNPTFDLAGKKEIICADCGAKIEEKILPKLEGEEGIYAEVQPGEFKHGSGEDYIKPTISYIKIESGEDFEAAKKLFPNLTDVFRIRFTKDGTDYIPVGKTEVTIEKLCNFNEKSRLFVLNSDGTATEVPCTKLGEKISFYYHNATFFISETYVPEPEPKPDDEGGNENNNTTEKLNKEDIVISKTKFIIICLILAVVFFGLLFLSVWQKGKNPASEKKDNEK